MKLCRCCGDRATAAEAAKSTDPEFTTCDDCVGAGCYTVRGSDGDQVRGKRCPLAVGPTHERWGRD